MRVGPLMGSLSRNWMNDEVSKKEHESIIHTHSPSTFGLHYLPQTLIVVELTPNCQSDSFEPNKVTLCGGPGDGLAVLVELA